VATLPRLAVFDMIGTTVEAGSEVGDAFRSAFAPLGVRLSDGDIDAVRGRSKLEAIEELTLAFLPDHPHRSQVVTEVYASFRSGLQARYETGSRAVPGARAALERLIELDIPVVLTTGLDRDTAGRIVGGLGWSTLGLLGVLTGDDVTNGRPAPDLVFAAMALAGVRDATLVLVAGDTTADLEAASRAKAGWNIGVLSGAHSREQLEACPHTALLGSVAELPDYLLRRVSLP
jgi:phosphonatase-like hydrolase